MSSIFEISARRWAWYVTASIIAVIGLPIVGQLFHIHLLVTLVVTTIFLISALAGLLFFETKKNTQATLSVGFIFCAYAVVIVIKFLIAPAAVFFMLLAEKNGESYMFSLLEIFLLFFTALGTFFFYRILCYLLEWIFGRGIHFGKKKTKEDEDRLLTTIRFILFVVLGTPLVLLVIFQPAVFLIPLILLIPFAGQAGVFFIPLYGAVIAALLVLFALVYALACLRIKKEGDAREVPTRMQDISWLSTVLLLTIHIFWILSMQVLGIVLRVHSFGSGPGFSLFPL